MTAVDGAGTLAEALRQHRWTAAETPPGSREEDYRPGAPCMDCGDYPGPRHDRSDCVRALAAALAPVVADLIAQARRDAAAEALEAAARDIADSSPGYIGRVDTARSLRARAAALRGGERP